jgi:hypothetical protein
MIAERWRQVEKLFQRVADLPEAEPRRRSAARCCLCWLANTGGTGSEGHAASATRAASRSVPRDETLGQALGAVALAHQRLVAHRDLKPSNIMINADGTARLLDFGIARAVSSSGHSREL